MQAEEEESTDPPSAAAGARRPPRLVLHFDLNETIMVTDAAGGDDFNACLNKMVAKSVFLKGDFEKHKHGDGATQPLTHHDGTTVEEARAAGTAQSVSVSNGRNGDTIAIG